MRYLWASASMETLSLRRSRSWGSVSAFITPFPPSARTVPSRPCRRAGRRKRAVLQRTKETLFNQDSVFGPDGRVIAAFEVTRDITDMKTRHLETEAKERYFRYLFENAPVGIFKFPWTVNISRRTRARRSSQCESPEEFSWRSSTEHPSRKRITLPPSPGKRF